LSEQGTARSEQREVNSEKKQRERAEEGMSWDMPSGGRGPCPLDKFSWSGEQGAGLSLIVERLGYGLGRGN